MLRKPFKKSMDPHSFTNLDPDPGTQLIADPVGYRSGSIFLLKSEQDNVGLRVACIACAYIFYTDYTEI